MNLGTLPAHNVVNLNAAYSQRIGDERTVATPWNRFRAHNRAPLLLSVRQSLCGTREETAPEVGTHV